MPIEERYQELQKKKNTDREEFIKNETKDMFKPKINEKTKYILKERESKAQEDEHYESYSGIPL